MKSSVIRAGRERGEDANGDGMPKCTAGDKVVLPLLLNDYRISAIDAQVEAICPPGLISLRNAKTRSFTLQWLAHC